jgi:hypothetical protein
MDRKQILDNYVSGAALLADKVKDMPDDLLNFRPDIEDAWTIKELVIHIVDSDINGFIRCKSIIAQPFSTCYVMNEELWTKNLRRKNEDIKKYLSVMKMIRELVYDLLIDEDESNWDKDYFLRPYKDETKQITISKLIDMYTNHVGNHIKLIDRNIEAYNGTY